MTFQEEGRIGRNPGVFACGTGCAGMGQAREPEVHTRKPVSPEGIAAGKAHYPPDEEGSNAHCGTPDGMAGASAPIRRRLGGNLVYGHLRDDDRFTVSFSLAAPAKITAHVVVSREEPTPRAPSSQRAG